MNGTRARIGYRPFLLIAWIPRRLAALALVVTMLGACSGSPVVPEHSRIRPQHSPPAIPAQEQPTAVAVTEAKNAERQRAIALALNAVARLRELPKRSEVAGRVATREELVDFVRELLDSEMPPEVITGSGEVLYSFMSVPADFNYRASILKLLEAELLGLYDPKKKVMLLGEGSAPDDKDPTLLHELVHALQDQHFDLQHLLEWRKDEGDAQSAIHALAEGDATSAMLDFMLQGKGLRAFDLPDSALKLETMLSLGAGADVPLILRRSLVAPYVDGLKFVDALRRKGGWASVNAAWRRLPESTEQLLHVDKYLAGEAAERLAIPELAELRDYRLVYHDVYGEQALELLFQEWLSESEARAKAADWAGDRIAVYAQDKRFVVLWRLRFDQVDAARRSFGAFGQGLKAQAKRLKASVVEPPRSEKLCLERPEHGPFVLQRNARDIGLILGPYERSPAGPRSVGNCQQALRWLSELK